MKKAGFVVQGKTFLKSMMPLVIFAHRVGIEAHLFLYNRRPGKEFDNVDISVVVTWIETLGLAHLIRVYQVRDDRHAIQLLVENKISAIMCQEITHHGPIFCQTPGLTTFSVGVFFDSLHCANRINAGQTKPEVPTRLYLANEKFAAEFNRLAGPGVFSIATMGSPFFDHCLFLKREHRKKRQVVFLSTLQRLVSDSVQDELEKFALLCVENDIQFVVKTKQKAPWKFRREIPYVEVVHELGFPGTSMSLLLNSDLHISSYSTSAVEAEYFGLPCLNLESVPNEKLTYAVNAIKNEYRFDELFNSETCVTLSENLLSEFERLIQKQPAPKEDITMDSNSSLRILTDMLDYL